MAPSFQHSVLCRLARVFDAPADCATHCRRYVRQNVVVTLRRVPRSGERSYKRSEYPD